MSKDKKRDESKTPKKIAVEAEVALLGLLMSIVSLIGLLNQGWLGSFLTYCLVYLFGSMHYVVLILCIYVGLFLFFKKKKPSIVLGINGLSVVILLFFLLIASSIYEGASISNWFNEFSRNFNSIEIASFKVKLREISMVGGGFIGYACYALFVTLLGVFASKIAVYSVILGCLYILLKRPVKLILKYCKRVFLKIKNKINRDSKEDRMVAFDRKEKIFDVMDEFNDDEEDVFEFEMNKEPFNEVIKSEESDVVIREGKRLSFDIFNEPLFDEEETVDIIEDVKQENAIVEEVNDASNGFVLDRKEIYQEPVREEKTIYSDEELEFYNEDVKDIEVQTASIPYVEEIVEVKQEVKKENKLNCKNIDVYSLLKDNNENNAYSELKDEVELNCDKINQKLLELNIKASVTNYIIGPCVTRYEIVPEIGVRVGSIVNIENDLKLALAAVKTRMEAPIPGKSAVGIEVANKKRYPVYLKEVLQPFKEDGSKLLVGIGRDLNNKEVVLNIDKMPHLLVAGATGSGKSVCINSMIVSLLLRTTPDEVKMILVDPKKVEMLPYANMPHLLCPVVTDPKKASVALKKVVKEMDRRYDEFANNGVRNIEGYNKAMLANGEKLLPNIVVIIDELADLMLVAAKEVEESIQRITQLARAAGIYLIVATQRPSVDVITGIIKANIPSRIAFSVSSYIDSKTIIDRGGAEELLGRGDMLMDISGSGALNRVQGVYVSDDEIFDIVKYVKSKYNTDFDEEFLNLEEEKQEVINNLSLNEDTNNDDALYEDIKDFVVRNQKASTSLLQRHFALGYSRAARMIDRLEADKVIGEANGAKPREILMTYNKEEESNE